MGVASCCGDWDEVSVGASCWCNDEVECRRDPVLESLEELDAVGEVLPEDEVYDLVSSSSSLEKDDLLVLDRMLVLFGLLCLADNLACSLHLAVALAHIFCLLRASFSAADSLASASRNCRFRCLPFPFLSISRSRIFFRILFLHNKQAIIKMQMTNVRTRDTARMSVLRDSCPQRWVFGSQPGGKVSGRIVAAIEVRVGAGGKIGGVVVDGSSVSSPLPFDGCSSIAETGVAVHP